jgi:hypothetical protein
MQESHLVRLLALESDFLLLCMHSSERIPTGNVLIGRRAEPIFAQKPKQIRTEIASFEQNTQRRRRLGLALLLFLLLYCYCYYYCYHID